MKRNGEINKMNASSKPLRPNDKLTLVLPAKQHRAQVEEYKQKFLDANDTMHGMGSLLKADSFDEWLQNCKDYSLGKNLLDGYVPATQYIAIRESDDELVGLIQIRHKLNPVLLEHGGHIGYSVAPDQRRKGYATQMLGLALAEAKRMGIEKVLLDNYKANVASGKVIKNNGGVLENEVMHGGQLKQRWWITVIKGEKNHDSTRPDDGTYAK